MTQKLSNAQIAWRAAQDIADATVRARHKLVALAQAAHQQRVGGGLTAHPDRLTDGLPGPGGLRDECHHARLPRIGQGGQIR